MFFLLLLPLWLLSQWGSFSEIVSTRVFSSSHFLNTAPDVLAFYAIFHTAETISRVSSSLITRRNKHVYIFAFRRTTFAIKFPPVNFITERESRMLRCLLISFLFLFLLPFRSSLSLYFVCLLCHFNILPSTVNRYAHSLTELGK